MDGRGKGPVAACLALAVLLGGGYVVGVSTEDAPRGDPDAPTPLLRVGDDCEAPCVMHGATERFAVGARVRQIHFSVYAQLDEESGPARIVVMDPTGDVRYDRLLLPRAEAGRGAQESRTWSAEAGEWTLSRTYLGVTGLVHLDVWTERP